MEIYGFFPGGDPRKFRPDPECCSEKEIAAWRQACAEWDAGNQTHCPSAHHRVINDLGHVVGTATMSRFGIGVYTYDEEE